MLEKDNIINENDQLKTDILNIANSYDNEVKKNLLNENKYNEIIKKYEMFEELYNNSEKEKNMLKDEITNYKTNNKDLLNVMNENELLLKKINDELVERDDQINHIVKNNEKNLTLLEIERGENLQGRIRSTRNIRRTRR